VESSKPLLTLIPIDHRIDQRATSAIEIVEWRLQIGTGNRSPAYLGKPFAGKSTDSKSFKTMNRKKPIRLLISPNELINNLISFFPSYQFLLLCSAINIRNKLFKGPISVR
jgi:hypothetical protein